MWLNSSRTSPDENSGGVIGEGRVRESSGVAWGCSSVALGRGGGTAVHTAADAAINCAADASRREVEGWFGRGTR